MLFTRIKMCSLYAEYNKKLKLILEKHVIPDISHLIMIYAGRIFINRKYSKCSQILEGHTDDVRALAVLPDGQIVSGSCDKTIRIWASLGHGKEEICLKGHTSHVYALAVLPDGRIVSGSDDGTIRIWALDGKEEMCLKDHTGAVYALAVLPDGRIVSGSDEKSIRIWE